MTPRESKVAWLPSTEQLVAAPERAALAALDASLLITIRVLMAEHVDLFPRGQRSRNPDYQPFEASLLPLAEKLGLCARQLHALVCEYRSALDDLLREGELDSVARPEPDQD